MAKGRHVPVKLGLLGDTFGQQFCELLKLPELFGGMISSCGITLRCSAPPACLLGNPYSYFLTATGGTEPYNFTIAAGTLPDGLSLNASTGEISGTPLTDQQVENVTFQVEDAEPETSQCSATFYVSATLDITTTTLPGATTGVAYSEQLAADGGVLPLVWSVASGSLPSGLSLSTSGLLSGTTTQTGTFNFAARATDSGVQIDDQALSVTVALAAPLFDGTILTQTADNLVQTLLVYNASQHFDTGGPVSTYALVNNPPWMTIGATSGIISAFPGPDAAADYLAVSVTATNTGGTATSNDFTMSVTANAPVFAGGPVPAIEVVDGQAITPPISTSQYFTTGGPVETYSLTNKPAWLDIDPVTGELSGTPVLGQDSADTTINATNVDGTDSSNTFTVTVQSSVVAPEFTGLPIPAITGEVLTPITPYNVAANGHFTGTSITYTMTGQPAGIEITPAGTIQGTPTASGNVSGIVVTASNAGGSADSFPFQAFIDALAIIPVYQDSAVATDGTTFNIAYDVNVVGSTGFTFTRDAGAPETLTGGVVSNNLITFSGVSPAILQGEVILLSYTAGDVVSAASGDPAADFSNQSTTNNSTNTGVVVPLFSRPFSETASLEDDATYARLSSGTLIDHEDVVRTAISGEARFEGARRIHNRLPTVDMNLWTKTGGIITDGVSDPDGGNNAQTLTATSASGRAYIDDADAAFVAGSESVQSFWIRRRTGTGIIDVRQADVGGWTTITSLVTGTWQRLALPRTTTLEDNGSIGYRLATSGDEIDVYQSMLQDKTGSSTPTIPDEYVSVGVLSSPWHGAGVDGVKYSTYDNGNSVDGNGIVTEAQGAPLSGISLLMEINSATNYASTADDLSGGADTIDMTTGGTGDFTLWVTGTAAVTVAAGTATGTGFGQATAGSPVTFNLSVPGTVTLTLDSGSFDTAASGRAIYQVEDGDTPSSWIDTGTNEPLSRAADELDYISATEITADNETRAETDAGTVDVDDWGKVVDETIVGADGTGRISSIDVYTTGERP